MRQSWDDKTQNRWTGQDDQIEWSQFQVKSFKNVQPRLRKRFQILAASLLASGLLAGIYCGTAPRYYSASADLVLDSDNEENRAVRLHSADSPTIDAISIAKQLLIGEAVLDQVIASLPEAHQVDWKDFPTQDPRDVLRKNLDLQRVAGGGTIRICCRSRQAETAVVILEKIFESSLAPFRSTATVNPSSDLERLARERQTFDQQLEAKEAELNSLTHEFESRFGISAASQPPSEEPSREHLRALELARNRHRDAKTRLAALEESIRSGWERSPSLPQHPPDHTQAHSANETSQSVNATRQTLIALEARLEDLLRRYGPAHSKVLDVQDQIRRTKVWLSEQEVTPASPIIQVAQQDDVFDQWTLAREQLDSAKAYEDLVREQYKIEQAWSIERANRLSQIATVQKELQDLRAAHAAIVHRQEEPRPAPDPSPKQPFTITVPPEESGQPATPNLGRCLAMSQGIGLLLGLSVIVFTERGKHGKRALEQFRRLLNAPIVGWIGELSATGRKGLDAVQTWARLDPKQTGGFNALRSVLERFPESQLLAVTSGMMGEGKTTVSANLAVEFAQAGKKTLLVDADFAGRGLSELLQFDDSRGLANVLREDTPMAESARQNVVPTLLPGLDVLPASAKLTDGTEPWEGPRWREFLFWAERIYGQVVIDLPALLTEPKVETIGRAGDGFLLVIQAERMKPATVNAFLKRLESLNLPWVGIVANRMISPQKVQSEASETGSLAAPDRNTEAA